MNDSHEVSQVASSSTLPGRELHEAAGGVFATYRGATTVDGYGDPAREAASLERGCAIIHRSWSGGLALSGADRMRFLNSQATCEVKDLAPGSGVFGFFVSAKGRVEADVAVLATADQLLLELPPGTSTEITARLEKYKVIDRVEITPLESTVLSLAGPTASETMAALGQEMPAGDLAEGELTHHEVELAGAQVRVVREPDLGGHPAWSVWLAPTEFEAVWRALEALGTAAPTPVGTRVWDRHRIRAGRPVFGMDFGADCFPQETGLGERGISYTKGCYLGQEVVARIHYRGGVQRRMCRLEFSRDPEANVESELARGQELQLDGKKVGYIGSVTEVSGGVASESLGLAVVHQKAEDSVSLNVIDEQGAKIAIATPRSLDPVS